MLNPNKITSHPLSHVPDLMLDSAVLPSSEIKSPELTSHLFSPDPGWLPQSVKKPIGSAILSLALVLGGGDHSAAQGLPSPDLSPELPSPAIVEDFFNGPNDSYESEPALSPQQYEIQDSADSQPSLEYFEGTQKTDLTDRTEQELGIAIVRERYSDYEVSYENDTPQDASGRIIDTVEVKVGGNCILKFNVVFNVVGIKENQPHLKLIEAHCSGNFSIDLSQPSQREILEELISRTQTTPGQLPKWHGLPLSPPFELANQALSESQVNANRTQSYNSVCDLNDQYFDLTGKPSDTPMRSGTSKEDFQGTWVEVYSGERDLSQDGPSSDDQHTFIEETFSSNAQVIKWENSHDPTSEIFIGLREKDLSAQLYGGIEFDRESKVVETLHSSVDSSSLVIIASNPFKESRELTISSHYKYDDLGGLVPTDAKIVINSSSNDSEIVRSLNGEIVVGINSWDDFNPIFSDSSKSFVESITNLDPSGNEISHSSFTTVDKLDTNETSERTLIQSGASGDGVKGDFQRGVRRNASHLDVWRIPKKDSLQEVLHNGPPPPDQPLSSTAEMIVTNVDQKFAQDFAASHLTSNRLRRVNSENPELQISIPASHLLILDSALNK